MFFLDGSSLDALIWLPIYTGDSLLGVDLVTNNVEYHKAINKIHLC